MKRLILLLCTSLLWAIPAQAQVNITLPASLTCSDGFAIVFASGLPTCAATAGVGTVTNTAFTTGTIPKASGGAALVDSLFTESGSTGTYTGTFNATVAVQLNGTPYAGPTQIAVLADNETVTGAWTFNNASPVDFRGGGARVLADAAASANIRLCADECSNGVDITDIRTLDGGGFRVVVNNGGTVGMDISVSGIYDDTTASAANVFVTSGGLLQRSTSSARYKTDVQPFGGGLADILRLQPKSFTSVQNPTGPRHLGFLAEDFDAAGLYNLVNYDDAGRPDAIQYDRLTTYIVNAIKELSGDVDTLKKAAGLPTSRTVSTPDTASRDKAIAQEKAMKAKRDKEAADAKAAADKRGGKS